MADSPWLCKVDRGLFAKDLDVLRGFDPAHVLSSHLPAASGASLDRLLGNLETAPEAAAVRRPGPGRAGADAGVDGYPLHRDRAGDPIGVVTP